MQIISFVSFDAHTIQIFVKLNIIRFLDLISFCNCLSIYKHFLSFSSSVFSNVFILISSTHEHNIRSASHGLLTKPSCIASEYGTNAFADSAIRSQSLFQGAFSNNNLCQLSYSKHKVLIKNHFFNSCKQDYS